MKITFSTAQRFGQLDERLFGHFLEHFHRQVYGGVFDPTSRFADEDGFREDVLEAMRRIKTPVIRWPGGCYVSAYDWHYGVGQPRIPTYDKAWRVEESNAFGTDEFIRLCRKLNCEPYICTNGGTGSAEKMSDWVEYCNLKDIGRFARERIANGFAEPHNVRYWSIGNENWGRHEIGSKDADEWAALVREAAKMMLRVDPTIELSAASIVDLDWNAALLRAAGDYLDWISIHSYWDFPVPGVRLGSDYDTCMLRSGKDISENIDRVRAYLTALGLENRIKVAYDEWNLRGWYHHNLMEIWNRDALRREDGDFYRRSVLGESDKNDINSQYTMADAVFSGAFLNTCMRNCDIVRMACFSPIVNTRGAIFTYDGGIVLRPQYFVFDLYVNRLRKNVLSYWSEDVPTLSGTDQGKVKVVDAVDVCVTADEGGVSIACVNKDPKSSHTLDITALERSWREARVSTVNGPTPNAYNDIGHTEVGLSEGTWTSFNGQVSVPPHSVNVIELR